MKLVGLGQNHELLDRLVLYLVVVGLAAETERGVVHIDIESSSVVRVSSGGTHSKSRRVNGGNPPGREMENIQEGGDGVACGLANVCLLDQRVVEQGHGVLLLLVGVACGVLALGLLAGGRSGYVEPHLNHLVLAGRGLPALPRRLAILTVRLPVLSNGELDGNLISTSQVGVRDLGVRDLEGGPVLNVEGQLGLSRTRPFPSSIPSERAP